LEAVGDRGVRMTSWLNLRTELYIGGFFEKIVTRKLIYEMTSERLNDLDDFRRATVGHSYGLSPKKLFFNQKSTGNLRGQIEQDRQFFCSELIAKAFKVLGVMKNPEQKSSANYYPGSFASKEHGGIIDDDLIPSVALGPTLNILVNAKVELEKDEFLQNQRDKYKMDDKIIVP
jgi:hypothetical protein